MNTTAPTPLPLKHPGGESCARCGKGAKDGVGLTKSHVPAKAIARVIGFPGLNQQIRKEYLCVHCHRDYTILELKVVQDGMFEIAQKLCTLHDTFTKGEPHL
jgi:hypothetical protein